MKLHERIKKCRLECGMTLLELANALGVREATAQRYESGEIKNLKQTTVLEMARIFNCSPSYLMGWEDNEGKVSEGNALPLLGKIAAGQPILATEDCEYFSPINDTKADFCLKVKGDSMIGAGIKDGDIVFIRKQDSVDDGEIAAVLVEDEATLKRVYITDDAVTLISENPKYKPMIYTKKQCKNIRILGKAVACHTNLN
ncbi:MAG: helix-turn-helix domain-containing protein [Ruminococcaceae bacterium]|nr:helix-turn-helix domain-containing protein [Oscillospiraceae bacterium]